MKKYELKYTKGEQGVFRMSTVESPATKTTLVMFDNEQKFLQFADDEKKVIYSVAMRPNMLIPRKDINGEPAMVFYTEETVNDLQQNFFKNNSHNGATINHDGKSRSDMYAFESWIVDNPEKDKATSLGLDVKKGDWVLGQKIDNEEVWKDVKGGKLQGFSIEAFLEPVLIKQQINMTQEEVDARIKAVMMATEEEKAAEAAKLAEEEKLAMAAVEPIVDPMPTEEPKADLQKIIDDKDVEINDLKAKISELENKAIEMSSELEATKKVTIEMSEDMKKGIKPNPIQKDYSEMTALEKFRANK